MQILIISEFTRAEILDSSAKTFDEISISKGFSSSVEVFLTTSLTLANLLPSVAAISKIFLLTWQTTPDNRLLVSYPAAAETTCFIALVNGSVSISIQSVSDIFSSTWGNSFAEIPIMSNFDLLLVIVTVVPLSSTLINSSFNLEMISPNFFAGNVYFPSLSIVALINVVIDKSKSVAVNLI